MPRGNGFVDYPTFNEAYQALKRATGGFERLEPEAALGVVKETADVEGGAKAIGAVGVTSELARGVGTRPFLGRPFAEHWDSLSEVIGS